MEKFSLEIETRYLDDAGESENVFDMSSAELNTRIVGKIPFILVRIYSWCRRCVFIFEE